MSEENKNFKELMDLIDVLRQDFSFDNLQKLQKLAQETKLTTELVLQVEKIKPEELKILAKKVFGLMPWEEDK
jgi:hypothetical protein